MVSIKDVAKHAGVSNATVSRVIHGSTAVSDKKKKAVFDAMEKLNYQPNLAARMLAGGKSGFIGLVMPEFHGPIFSRVIAIIEDLLLQYNSQIIVTVGHSVHELEHKAINALLSRQVDGLITFTECLSDDEIVDLSQQIPLVALNRHVKAIEKQCIWQEIFEVTNELVQHLVSMGHRHAHIITGAQHVFDGKQRLIALEQAAQEYGMSFDKIACGDFSYQTAYKIMEGWIQEQDIPKLVFAANDQMAIGAINACRAYNISYPDDVDIIGYDGVHFLEPILPRISTVRVPILEMAQNAVYIALNLAYNKSIPVVNSFHPYLSFLDD